MKTDTETNWITIDKILHPDFVGVDGAGQILGYKRQTIHNKTSDGTLKLPEFGRVAGSAMVYHRGAVEDVARTLGRAVPERTMNREQELHQLLDEFDRYNSFEATYVNSPFYERVQRALGRGVR